MGQSKTLNLRREPEQDRSRAGVAAILDAAAQLLDHHGIDHVTMTAIAQRAGLSKAAVYRYFPNKAAIVRGLAQRSFEEDAVRIAEFFERAEGEPAEVLVEGMREYLDEHRKQPHRVQLRAAIRADPELAQLDVADSQRNAREIVEALRKRGSTIPSDVLRDRVFLFIELADGVNRLGALVSEPVARGLRREFLEAVAERFTDA
ncbi:MAG: TetR/AcrR family transcriptional regulator [Acidobacteriota bacterium]